MDPAWPDPGLLPWLHLGSAFCHSGPQWVPQGWARALPLAVCHPGTRASFLCSTMVDKAHVDTRGVCRGTRRPMSRVTLPNSFRGPPPAHPEMPLPSWSHNEVTEQPTSGVPCLPTAPPARFVAPGQSLVQSPTQHPLHTFTQETPPRDVFLNPRVIESWAFSSLGLTEGQHCPPTLPRAPWSERYQQVLGGSLPTCVGETPTKEGGCLTHSGLCPHSHHWPGI